MPQRNSKPRRLRGTSAPRVVATSVLFTASLLTTGACSDDSSMTRRERVGVLPCEVARVFTSVCQNCHSSPPRNDAPFPLVTYVDTQEVVGGRPITDYMLAALETGRMPMPPYSLTAEDRAMLVDWLRADAPPRAVGVRCDSAETGVDAGSSNEDASTD